MTNNQLMEKAEKAFLQHYITKIYPTGLCSYVADSYDYFRVINTIIPELKEVILARQGKLVVRGDSGNPVDILCETVESLWNTFGGAINEKGYKELDGHIGTIYGDSITYDRAKQIFERLESKGFSSTNVVMGTGSYFYNGGSPGGMTRDCLGWAIKSTCGKIGDKVTEIFKDPKTDNGTKKSAKGYLKVGRDENNELILVDQVSEEETYKGEMRLVFKDGILFNEETFDVIRARLKAQ